MPEEYTEEETRETFAAMRTEVLTYVRPGDPAQVARTVRRHRATSTVALAATVAVAVAGVAVATNLVVTDRSAPPATPSPSPSPSPLTEVALNALAHRAAAAIGVDAVNNRQRRAQGKGPIVIGGPQPVKQASSGIVGGAAGGYRAGDYVYEIACVGQGTLRARFWAGPSNAELDKQVKADKSRLTAIPPDAVELRVTCSDHPVTATARAHAPAPRLVYMSVEPDRAAIGHAGYADLVRLPNRDGS